MGFGVELVTNGHFSDGGTGWIYVPGETWDIIDGHAVCLMKGQYLEQEILGESGANYFYSFEIGGLSAPIEDGAIKMYLTAGSPEVTENGIYTFTHTSVGYLNAKFYLDAATYHEFWIDNVSIRKITGGMGFGHTLIQNYYENF